MKFSDYIINNVYVEDGENGLYYHDGVGTYTNADQEAGDNSYRYAGANPNNYVCFGSDEETCPEDNLYRIIGVFDDKTKLIKSSSANSNFLGNDGDYGIYDETNNFDLYYWNNHINSSSGIMPSPIKAPSTNWPDSILNTVNLNTNYLNNISYWKNYISTYAWHQGQLGCGFENDRNVFDTFNYEVTDDTNEYMAKIGLLFVSEYMYASDPQAWLYYWSEYSKAVDYNWLYIGIAEWLMTIFLNCGYGIGTVCNISSSGTIESSTVGNYSYGDRQTDSVVEVLGDTLAVRPTFYLKPEVTYISGDGTEQNPYRIECSSCTTD